MTLMAEGLELVRISASFVVWQNEGRETIIKHQANCYEDVGCSEGYLKVSDALEVYGGSIKEDLAVLKSKEATKETAEQVSLGPRSTARGCRTSCGSSTRRSSR